MTISDSAGSDSDVDDYRYGIKVAESGLNRVKDPYANVTVNKHKLKMLVNSGSSVNILDEEDYAKVGGPQLREKNKSRELVPYGGDKIPVFNVRNKKEEL